MNNDTNNAITPNENKRIVFSLFSFLLPFICYLIITIFAEYLWKGQNTITYKDTKYTIYLAVFYFLASIHIGLFIFAKSKNFLPIGTFIANLIALFIFSTLPIFGLFYGLGFIFISPFVLYYIIVWFFNTIYLCIASRLFRIFIFSILLYLIIAKLCFLQLKN